MPGMSGRESAEAVKKYYPDTRIVYMSGHIDDAALRLGILERENHFIQKPVRPIDLVRKVGEALDAPQVK